VARIISALGVLTAIFSGSSTAYATYRVSQWASFEDLQLPPGSRAFGKDLETRLAIPNIASDDSLKGPSALGGGGPWELGKGALRMEAKAGGTSPKEYVVGLAVGTIQDRNALGDKGNALYQADFFIPKNDAEMPSLAVLAMEPIAADQGTSGLPFNYYRFGITLGKSIYFSCVQDPDKAAAVYFNDSAMLKSLPRGVWHRFAIHLEGAETIHCYIDGKEPGFSPIKDTRLKQLQVGVMLAENKRSYTSYVDNLSIQLSDGPGNLPRSPFAGSWPPDQAGGVKAAAAAPKSTPPPVQNSSMPALSVINSASDIQWSEAEMAWGQSLQNKKPMLLLFDSPETPASQKLDGIIKSSAPVREFLSKHNCARLDVNQLHGGTVAKQYNVWRVPTVLIIAPEGNGGARKVLMESFGQDVTVQEFSSKLGIR
jgi:hypothetical protein